MTDSKIIAVDFDGTIVEHRYPKIGNPVPLAVVTLRELKNAGHRIIIYTMRSSIQLQEALDWLKEWDFVPWAINKNPQQETWTASPKVYAHFYIDDAAIGCPLIQPGNGERPYVDWGQVRVELHLRGIDF